MENIDLRFLVVEDHGFQRWIVANLLEGLGAKYVFSAADGKEALDLLIGREPPIDIVVTDLDMPGMDGMEFIRNIAQTRNPASLILASGMEPAVIASVEAMTRAYGLNLLGSIVKPVTARKLAEAIRVHATLPRTNGRVDTPSFSVAEITGGLQRGEFEPFFQPKVELSTQAVKGAEAVARWRHPREGIIRPEAFIASMEEHGLIEALTEVMVKQAAHTCRKWRDAGLDATVAVNLSLKSLHDVTLADRVTDLVVAQGLQPRDVVFEVTESAAVSDLGRTLENLSRLRMKGFGLSIDDYGTGYSSMERLARVPFTELKIDQSFLRNAHTEKPSRAMLESSLEMAVKLGIVAVAEGVESRVEWELLRSLGCPLSQGYYVARPMEAEEFLVWVRTPRKATA